MSSQIGSWALLSGLRISLCRKLWCRSRTRLRSCVAGAGAVAVAGSYSSDSTPSLGTSICPGCSPKKTKRRRKKKSTNKRKSKLKGPDCQKLLNLRAANVGEDIGQPKLFFTIGENCHWYNHFEKQW